MYSLMSFLTLVSLALCSRYDPLHVDFNLNQNKTATNPLDYWGEWANHTYNPSPKNWRFPFYTFFLDRFVNGDPSNDNINGTVFEQDVLSNQYRHGGDVAGLADSLDYLQGMGIKGLYVAGSPFMNQPWTADSYSPLDLTILDHHFGTIEEWRAAIDDIHRRGMYIVLDNTFGTMGDLLGFEGYLNDTTPFTLKEHKVVWKLDRRYLDFDITNDYLEECEYPRFWNETGYPIDKSYTNQMKGCYNSDMDHYGDTEAFGVWPDYQRQLSKFASVQDRLREWKPSVKNKLQHFSCIAMQMLDIDGFRFDKATQITVDAMADFNQHMRECAKRLGKDNFFLPGEITGGNNFASIYLGRGRQPDMKSPNASFSTTMTTASDSKYFIREKNKNALDGAAFHYSVYRSLTRFLGMDGNLEAGYDLPRSWTDSWNDMLVTNDFVNPSTNQFDPRHMFGVTNQDVFRWPAIKNGTERMLLGLYITTLHMPGIPKLTWGEEQAFYVLDSTASNYIYGRQPMTSAAAWQMHGCYALGSTQYYQMPLEAARNGCRDEGVALDHRDASHPVHNIIKHMYFLRQTYPVLNDGWFLRQLSNQTHAVQYPGSGEVTTETGIWSVLRDVFPDTQTMTTTNSRGTQSIWLLYHNGNDTTTYNFDCSKTETAMIAAFKSGTTVKNLFYPHDEITLQSATDQYGNAVGCTEKVQLKGYEFKAYVPKDQFVAPPPMITKFSPGHDSRVKSTVAAGSQESLEIEINFSKEMDCDQITSQMIFNSTTEDLRVARVRPNSVNCSMSSSPAATFVAAIPGAWSWKAILENVSNGVHSVTVRNATAVDKTFSNSVDRFLFRVGQSDNPMVFPQTANYTRALIHRNSSDDSLYISHKAAGANKWRYSLNWGSTWSDWQSYTGGNNTLPEQPWSGTKRQKWSDTHVIAQYWGRLSGSSAVVQHADLGRDSQPPRRWPHIFAHGPFNQYGFDAGLKNALKLNSDGRWNFHFMSEWSGKNTFQLNVWGMNPDGQPDASAVYGDIDGDGVLDRLPPSSLSKLNLSVSEPPPAPYLAYQLSVDDGTFRYTLYPVGDRRLQLILYILLAFVPLITGCFAVWVYMRGFYAVKFNEIGMAQKPGFFQLLLGKKGAELLSDHETDDDVTVVATPTPPNGLDVAYSEKRRTVLIATMEYDIEDWNIKIKIGGLGVMAQLMGKNLEHQDLIWVVPCVQGVDYPIDEEGEPMTVTIMDIQYDVSVQYHKLRNITYVLLDAPVFRAQTKSEPYPARMDDMDSAVYYSAWNQCIAQAIERFPIDLYHINDYHGAAAPLYMLPRTIPCCLSLHNAEFQGLWPMRNPIERKEVCSVFNLPESVVQKYIQFGSVFNLLHAGSSYLSTHQKGFGAVGVSKKYGKRSWSRYAVFWQLSKVEALPNPDPSDTDAWDKQLPKESDLVVDPAFEARRPELKRQAQEWAGLEQRADAELFVFVGRWSTQKGIDLIADVFPSILEHHEKVQLITIGPVIDLYGKFAALKLSKMMEKYPGRVFSKPEFTALPPFIFSGAEFALIPSRDEPFGLVAVEFGRKGALGVGARVGGLGLSPGWWYTVESITTSHLIKQFKEAIESALASKQDTRAMMRARSAKQRFPVQQWKEDLEILQANCIKIHTKETDRRRSSRFWSSHTAFEPVPEDSEDTVQYLSTEIPQLAFAEEVNNAQGVCSLKHSVSLGSRRGPGHVSQNSHSSDASEHLRMASNDNDDAASLHDEYIMQVDDEGAIVPVSWDDRTDPSTNSDAGISTPERPSSARHSSIERESPENFAEIKFDEPSMLSPPKPLFLQTPSNRSSLLSLGLVVGERKDYKLQKVDPFFTDSNGEFYNKFSTKLDGLTAKNSESDMCIEDFLVKSERSWFKRFREARLGMASAPVSRPVSRPHSIKGSVFTSPDQARTESTANSFKDEFLLGFDYKPPRYLKKYLQMKIGDWPVYTILLAFGQIIAANSYQITLLTGTVGQSAEKLYAIASIYLVTSIFWWCMFRRIKAVYCLSTPFIFYGLAFLLLGFATFLSGNPKFWMQNVATGLYATASSSGSLFFALNFGDEGGAPVKDWIFRACMIQGTQQLYVAGLWYWGSTLAASTTAGIVKITSGDLSKASTSFATSPRLAAVTTPIAVLLWTVGILIQIGLPDFYRQAPGAIPSFYKAIARRKIVLWTLVTVILQNFFLSAPYGRNWQFLWSSQVAPAWAVALLFLLFFLFIWIGILFVFAKLSIHHSWILPIFAIGLGAPRWCQMLWGTSSIGLYLPWAGGAMSSALVSRSLWLWLGLLDTIQGVGFGMIFLQTLTRMHVAFTLIAAQVLGSIATIVARAVAPNRLGPGDVFPDFSAGAIAGLVKPWFWVALIAQVAICFGFFKFFRKEQLSKP